jgi:alanyl-tRNA synthetase
VAAKVEAEELIKEAEAGAHDSRIVARSFDGRDAESLKLLASALASHAGAVALLGAREGDAARLVFARAADAPGDMNALMREACAIVEGRGGGRAEMAQGGGTGGERVGEAIEAAARTLRGQ